jgi:hypothetical protein
MPRPPRIDSAEAVYHATSRGNGRAHVFSSDDDRRRLLGQLAHRLQLTLSRHFGIDPGALSSHGHHAGRAKATGRAEIRARAERPDPDGLARGLRRLKVETAAPSRQSGSPSGKPDGVASSKPDGVASGKPDGVASRDDWGQAGMRNWGDAKGTNPGLTPTTSRTTEPRARSRRRQRPRPGRSSARRGACPRRPCPSAR